MAAMRPERRAAITAGERTYIPAQPCANGHIGPKLTKTAKCIPCLAAARARWLKVRPGLEAEWARKRRAKDPAGHRAEVKQWATKNREKANETVRRWKAAHPELNRERGRIYMACRRTRKAKNGGSFTEDDVAKLYEKQRGRCAACHKRASDMEIDHIVPIIRGGCSNPHNLQLLCLFCNRSKGGKDPIIWAQENGKLL